MQKPKPTKNSFINSLLFVGSLLLLIFLFSACSKKNSSPATTHGSEFQNASVDPSLANSVMKMSHSQELAYAMANDDAQLKSLKLQWGDLTAADVEADFIENRIKDLRAVHFLPDANKEWPRYNAQLTVLRNANPSLEAVTAGMLKQVSLDALVFSTVKADPKVTAAEVQNLADNTVLLVNRVDYVKAVIAKKLGKSAEKDEQKVFVVLKDLPQDQSNLKNITDNSAKYTQVAPTPYREVLYVHGYAAGLDPHSYLLSQEGFKRMTQPSQNLVGVGAVIEEAKDGSRRVVNVVRGSPAQIGGVQVGDIVTAVDGKDAASFANLNDMVAVIRGAEGTAVKLTVKRKGQTQDLNLVRKKFEIFTVDVLDSIFPDTSFAKISQFTQQITAMLHKGLEQTGKRKFVVIDLRSNGGGMLQEAIQLIQYLTPTITPALGPDFRKLAFYIFDGKGFASRTPIWAQDQGLAQNVIMLTNEQSASASEIVSGNMKALGKTLLIGTRTFGKGSMQQLEPLNKADPNNSKLLAATTRGLYYNGDHRSPQFSGVEPHFNTGALRKTLKGIAMDDFTLESDQPGAIPAPAGEKPALAFPNDYPQTIQCLKDLETSNKLVDAAELDQPTGLQVGLEGVVAGKAIECMINTGEAN